MKVNALWFNALVIVAELTICTTPGYTPGALSEIFDGDPPHTPRGCISQAWSVGETLRVLTDLEKRRIRK